MNGELKARKNVPVKMWIPPHEVESSALDQLKNVADLVTPKFMLEQLMNIKG